MQSVIEPIFVGPGPDAQFDELLKQGRFCIQHCGGCTKAIFYPRVLCPYCGSPDLHFRDAEGGAEVYSTSVQRRRPDKGGDLNIAIVTLSEGPRMMSRVEGIDPHAVKIGQRVRAHLIEDEEGPLVIFRPEEN